MISNNDTETAPSAARSSGAPDLADARWRLAAAVATGVFVTLAWHYLHPEPWTWLVLVAAVPLAVFSRNYPTLHVAVFAALATGVPKLFPTYPSIFVAKGAALAAYLILSWSSVPLRRGLDWLSVGQIRPRTWAAAAVFLAAFAGFTTWYLAHHRPPAPHILVAASGTPSLAFILAGAAVNALAEEVFWRGTMQTELQSLMGSAPLAVTLQALHFGLAHYRGPFFAGWPGVIGAALMGLLMGHFRQRTGALLLPWLLHFACDTVILALAAHLVLS